MKSDKCETLNSILFVNSRLKIITLSATPYFWLEIGKRMNIQNLPKSLEEMETFKLEYETKLVRNSQATKELGEQ